MISNETGFSLEKLKKGNFEIYEWEQLNQKARTLTNAPLFIIDSPSLTIDEIIDIAEKNITENLVEIIFLDYVQLLNLGNLGRQNREEELSIAIKKLKYLSKKYNIPIIVSSQLNRSVETRGGSKRPLLYDLRDSGSIEDDSDVVMFLYRPEYYGYTEWDDDDHTPCENQAELIIVKNRFGNLARVRLDFQENITKFSNHEHSNIKSEFSSSMKSAFDDDFSPNQRIEPKDAFGDDDVPF